MRKTAWITLPAALVLLAGGASAQTFNGTLGPTDPVRESGQSYDTYKFQVAAHQIVVVTMTSEDFDTYLIVRSPTGVTTENDDASNGSKVTLITGEGGEWTIDATSYGEGMTGNYVVNVALGPVGESTTIEGRLDHRDAQSIKGEYYDAVRVQLPPGGEYYVELASLGFDGYLALQAPNGSYTRNDDAGSTELSRVGPIAGESGDWTAFVTSVSGDEVGAYDLRVIRFPEGARAMLPAMDDAADAPDGEGEPDGEGVPNRAGMGGAN